jgi:hypothetical protein
MANSVNSVKALLPGLILLAVLVSEAAFAKLPQHTYACEVQTQAGVAGLVMVQSDSLAEAEAASGKAMAHKLAGGKSRAVSVVECIVAGEGRFRDGYFQDFYESVPR